MKSLKNHFSIYGLVAGIILFSAFSGNALTIISNPGGGNWNSAGTWQGGQIPGAADNVIIAGGSTVSTILGIYNQCNDLTVEEGATLINNGLSNATLTVNGSLYQYGSIKNGVAFLTLVIRQNIIFDGIEWSNYKVTMQGAETRDITFANLKVFTGSLFSVEGTTRQINALSSLTFSGTAIDFNGSTLQMSDMDTLAVRGQSLTEIILTGNSYRLSMRAGAVLSNSTLVSPILQDTIRIGANNVNLENTATISPNAVVMNFGSSHTLNINGSVTNQGTITDGSNFLTLYITGHLVQEGIWENYSTYLSGYTDQWVTMGDGKWFSGKYFYSNYFPGKVIRAQSDLRFTGCILNMANGAAGGIRGDLTLPDEGKLSVFATTSIVYAARINLMSSGNTAHLHMTGGSYLQSFSNSCNVLKLYGRVLVGNNEFYLNNEIRVLDTLANYSLSGHVLYLTGTILNYGWIMNGQATLEMNINGSISHDGMEWSNHKIQLSGTGERTLRQGPASRFSCSYLESSSAVDISVPASLSFYNTRINLFNSTMDFQGHDSLCMTGPQARLVNCQINGHIELRLSQGAYLQSVTLSGHQTLQGQIHIYNNEVSFNGATINRGILQNQNMSAHLITFNGSFRNAGTVINGQGMGNLTAEFRGNVINEGSWINYENRINGAGDQHIRLAPDAPVASKCILYSNLGGSNYQWFKDNIIVQGATSPNLTLNQVSTAEYGVYHCTSSLGLSRIITIQGLPVVAFAAGTNLACPAEIVQFTDSTPAGFPIQEWHWDFGDGESSDLQHPAHQYSVNGNYTVALTVTDGYISETLEKPDYILVSSRPEAAFSAHDACFGSAITFTDLSTGQLYDHQENIQYATAVTGFSSEYSDTDWAALQALGEPDVYPVHQDNVHAWASLTANGQREYLMLRFPEAVHSSGVIIYETLHPGAVDSVFLRDISTGTWHLAWWTTATSQPLQARALRATFPPSEFLTDEIRIAINSPAVAYWNEIDAVALVSPADTVISTGTTYDWDPGTGDTTILIKGDIQFTYQTPGTYQATLTITNNGLCSSMFTLPVTVYPLTEGGYISGGKTIHWGESTGSLTLLDYSGNILEWQRKRDDEAWVTIFHTSPVYEEIPPLTGSWHYRALVQNPLCGQELSEEALVEVLKPLQVVWNGNISNNWSTAENWTPPVLPDEEITAVIPFVTPFPQPQVNSNNSCKDLIILPDAGVLIIPGVILRVFGDCLVQSP